MDIRLKKDIYNTCNLLDKLDKLNFIKYNTIDNDTLCEVGIIAQELNMLFPSMVNLNEGYIPNINMIAEHDSISDDILFIRINYNIIINNNDKILIKIRKFNEVKEIGYTTTINNPTGVSFEIKKWYNYESSDILYVYGTQVNDLHRINTTDLGILGTACTKELYQIVKHQDSTISTLQNQLTQLTAWATNQGYVPPE